MNRGAWWTTVHGVTKSRTRLKQLSTHICVCVCVCIYIYIYIEREREREREREAKQVLLKLGLCSPVPSIKEETEFGVK